MYGAKITSIRLTRGYTQEYVAHQIGIDQRTYSKIEKDTKVKMDDDLLEKIAKALGVSVEDIKNPFPIIMQFNSSPNSGFVNSNSVYNDTKVLEALQEQVKVKDSQINELNRQISSLLALIKKES